MVNHDHETTDEDREFWNYQQTSLRNKFQLSYPRFQYLRKLTQRQKRKGVMLDIGIGDGYFLSLMARRGFICFGMDLSNENILLTEKIFKEKGVVGVTLKVGNINAMPFDDRAFEIVTASEVLEHLTDGDLGKGIREIDRILKDDGVFIGTVPCQEDLSDHTHFCPFCKKAFHVMGHKQSFDKKKLLSLFDPFFKKVEVFQWLAKPATNSPVVDRLKYWLKRLLFILWKDPRIFKGSYIIIAKN